MSIKYKDSEGNFQEIKIKTKDSLPVGTIVDYDGDTVPDGYEEADSMDINNGVVLWENPNTTVEFIAQTINLSSSNYDYVEISFARRIIDDVGNKIRIEKAEKNTSGHTESEYLTTGTSVNIASRLFSISDNTISFENNLLQQTGSSRAINNNYNVPIKVIGYKNKISIALEQESVYSTEETVVGKWFGKPLYRKCFQLNIESSMGTTAFAHNIANIDEYTPNCKGIIKRTENRAIPVPFIYLDDTQWSTGLELNNDSFGVDVGSKLREQLDTSSNYNCIVVLEYTKTTDTEGV